MKRILFFALVVTMVACKSKEEQKQEAEEEGKFQTEKKSRIVKGIGEGLKGEGKDAAESISEGVGEVFKSFGKGYDESIVKIEVRVDESLEEEIDLGRTGKHLDDSTMRTNVALYIIYNKDFEDKVVLKAYDDEDVEIGRHSAELSNTADNAEFVDFEFDKRTPLTYAEYFVLEKK